MRSVFRSMVLLIGAIPSNSLALQAFVLGAAEYSGIQRGVLSAPKMVGAAFIGVEPGTDSPSQVSG